MARRLAWSAARRPNQGRRFFSDRIADVARQNACESDVWLSRPCGRSRPWHEDGRASDSKSTVCPRPRSWPGWTRLSLGRPWRRACGRRPVPGRELVLVAVRRILECCRPHGDGQAPGYRLSDLDTRRTEDGSVRKVTRRGSSTGAAALSPVVAGCGDGGGDLWRESTAGHATVTPPASRPISRVTFTPLDAASQATPASSSGSAHAS
jgi:hypothetical protein